MGSVNHRSDMADYNWANLCDRRLGSPCCLEKRRSISASRTWARTGGLHCGFWSLSIKRALTPSRKSELAQKFKAMSHSRRKTSFKVSFLPSLICRKIAFADVG